ncbi:hypothetical protein Ccrd_004120 [Cynara cardunculus var. scolymus]|uniref:Uncharacterized protein n=1 Tax=Cynara cardunculus var. scolymus TaxID=59895 RepID=A0A103XN33_CYNCS|nr:hypothetical protein Ccrd_004120 [Cynara cardunculus var. scolymus]
MYLSSLLLGSNNFSLMFLGFDLRFDMVLSKCDYDGIVAHIFCLRRLSTLYKKDNCRPLAIRRGFVICAK